MNFLSRQVMLLLVGSILVIIYGLLIWFSEFTAATMAMAETLYSTPLRSASSLTPHPLLPSKPIPISAYSMVLTQMSTSTPTLQMLIPLYIYPDPNDSSWDKVAAATCHIRVTAIINPDSGPGIGGPDVPYQQGLTKLRQAGVTILGYVNTDYGLRPVDEAKADVDQYDQYFNIHGIFFDQVASSVDKLAYYKELYDYVKSKSHLDGAKVVLNPGTQIDEDYIKDPPASDTAVIFEGLSSDWPPYVPDPYVINYPRERFAALSHTTPDTATMRSHIDLAIARHIGYVYVTDDTLSNPYDRLPIYWGDEVSYIKSYNGQTIPGRFCLYLPLVVKDY
jgi:hypothetical protein